MVCFFRISSCRAIFLDMRRMIAQWYSVIQYSIGHLISDADTTVDQNVVSVSLEGKTIVGGIPHFDIMHLPPPPPPPPIF